MPLVQNKATRSNASFFIIILLIQLDAHALCLFKLSRMCWAASMMPAAGIVETRTAGGQLPAFVEGYFAAGVTDPGYSRGFRPNRSGHRRSLNPVLTHVLRLRQRIFVQN